MLDSLLKQNKLGELEVPAKVYPFQLHLSISIALIRQRNYEVYDVVLEG